MHLDDDSATQRRPVTDSSVRSGPPRQFDSRPATRATGSRPPPHRTAASTPQFDHHHGNGVYSTAGTTAQRPSRPRTGCDPPATHRQAFRRSVGRTAPHHTAAGVRPPQATECLARIWHAHTRREQSNGVPPVLGSPFSVRRWLFFLNPRLRPDPLGGVRVLTAELVWRNITAGQGTFQFGGRPPPN